MPTIPPTEVVAAPSRRDTLLNIRIITPITLSTIPDTPDQVIRSRIKKADANKVIIGSIELIIEASMAVVWGMASKNVSWVEKSPKNEARAIFQ